MTSSLRTLFKLFKVELLKFSACLLLLLEIFNFEVSGFGLRGKLLEMLLKH
jgi:hypothetical protein